MNREWRMKRRAPCFFLTKKPFYCIIISVVCRCGEIGRHEGLKIPFWRQSTGSTPVGGMDKKHLKSLDFGCFLFAQNPPDNPFAGNDTLKQPRGTVRLPGAAAMYGFFGRAFYFSCAFRSEGARGAFCKPQFYLPGTGIYS